MIFATTILKNTDTPTSMVDAFKFEAKNQQQLFQYQLGSIRSAFFYLEMPQLYPLLYHECAHLQFKWDSAAKNDNGVFFASRKSAANSLEESAQLYPGNKQGFWNNFTEEIWADMIAINLGGLPYLTALTMQIMGQSSGQFFYSNPDILLQEWAKNPIYDLELPTQDQYFWQARLELAMHWLKKVRPKECGNATNENGDINAWTNQHWLEAISIGIKAYQQGGAAAFSAKRVSEQHEHWWTYRVFK